MQKVRARTLGLILLAGFVGYAIGPKVADAASTFVTIQDDDTTSNAQVKKGRLWVDTEANVSGGQLQVDSRPAGSSDVIVHQSAFATIGGCGSTADTNNNYVVTSVLVQVQNGSTDARFVLFKNDGSEEVYEVRASAGEHVFDTFDGGLNVPQLSFFCNNDESENATFIVYGYQVA